MSRFNVLLLLILAGVNSLAQNPDFKRTYHWYFGYEAGIDFSSGTPLAVTDGKMWSMEGCATISDTLGNLLFYTDGDTIWNSTHQPMPNAIGLLGCHLALGGTNSSTQGALILPKPGDSNKFYVFITDCAEDSLEYGLRYSIVDMSMNGGLGDLITKDVLLHNLVTEKLTAIKHANNSDYWLIAHEFNTNGFLAYLITSTGIDTIPIVSNIGIIQSGSYYNAIGYLKPSPNGKKLALAIQIMDIIEIFDFNNSTGVISNSISLPSGDNDYGVSFSPDNSKLYVSTAYGDLFQFDLSSGLPVDIINSKTLIASVSSLGALQLGPDGKIYIATNGKGYLDIIDNPNEIGLSCNYIENGFYLSGKPSALGLPNFIESYFQDTIITDNIIEKSDLQSHVGVYPNPNTGQFTLEMDLQEQTRLSIKLYHFTGQLIHSEVIGNVTGNYAQQMDLGRYAKGIYYVQIVTDVGVITKKVVYQ